MPHDWYVMRPDGIDGPFTSNEIRQQASDDRLAPDSPVSRDRRQWFRASQLKGLVFGSPSPALPRADDATSGGDHSGAGQPSGEATGRHQARVGSVAGHDPSATGRLWLMAGDMPDGPFEPARVHEKLEAGEVTWQTLACPVGGSTWLPLVQLPGFGPIAVEPPPAPVRHDPLPRGPESPATSAASPAHVSPPEPHDTTSGSLLTNLRLPEMANRICIYSLLVSPFLWIMNNATCCVTGPTYREDSTFFAIEVLLALTSAASGLACSVLLFVGGLRLRSLRSSGVRLLRLGFGLSLGLSAAEIVLNLMLGFVAATSEGDAFIESSDVMNLVNFLFLGVGLAVVAFQIIALVWLARHSESLPLS